MPTIPDSLQGKFFCTHFGQGLTGVACIGRQEADPSPEEGFLFCTRGLCDQGAAVAKACGVAVKRWAQRQAEQLRPPAPSPTGGHFQHRRSGSPVARTAPPPRDTGPRIPSASERPPEARGVPAWKAAQERIQDIVPAFSRAPLVKPQRRPAPAPPPRPPPEPEPEELLLDQVEDVDDLEPEPLDTPSAAATPPVPPAPAVKSTPPIDIAIRPKTPLVPAAPPPPAEPAPAPKEPPMVTATNTAEKPLCKRCQEKPLRPNNFTGVCSDCREELGSSKQVQAWVDANTSGNSKPAAAAAATPLRLAEQGQAELPGMPPPAALPVFKGAPGSYLLACLKALKAEVKAREDEVKQLAQAVAEFSAGE